MTAVCGLPRPADHTACFLSVRFQWGLHAGPPSAHVFPNVKFHATTCTACHVHVLHQAHTTQLFGVGADRMKLTGIDVICFVLWDAQAATALGLEVIDVKEANQKDSQAVHSILSKKQTAATPVPTETVIVPATAVPAIIVPVTTVPAVAVSGIDTYVVSNLFETPVAPALRHDAKALNLYVLPATSNRQPCLQLQGTYWLHASKSQGRTICSDIQVSLFHAGCAYDIVALPSPVPLPTVSVPAALLTHSCFMQRRILLHLHLCLYPRYMQLCWLIPDSCKDTYTFTFTCASAYNVDICNVPSMFYLTQDACVTFTCASANSINACGIVDWFLHHKVLVWLHPHLYQRPL